MTCKDTLADENWREDTPQKIKDMYSPKGCENFKNKEDFIEVKHGRWIPRLVRFGSIDQGYHARVQCSNCKKYFIEATSCCPNCGTKMDKEKTR